ncbi:MAG: sulfotransferase [Azospirillaceae bacterium]
MPDRSYFVVTGLGRSGSTMLTRLLNSHPEIECHGETISPTGLNAEHPDLGFRELIETRMFTSDCTVCGFKMPWDWLLAYPDVWATFKALGVKFIFLERENKLDLYVSQKLAEANYDWSSSRVHQKTVVEIDEEHLRTCLYQYEVMSWLNHKMAGAISDQVFRAYFSQLLDPGHQRDLLGFLGLDQRPLATDTVRARQKPLSEVVVNYSGLKQAFASSRWSWMFHDG